MLSLKFTKRIITGLAMIYLAGLGYVAEIIIPFLNISNKAVVFASVLVFSELLFLAGIAIIGKPTYNLLKSKLKEFVRIQRK